MHRNNKNINSISKRFKKHIAKKGEGRNCKNITKKSAKIIHIEMLRRGNVPAELSKYKQKSCLVNLII